MFEDSPTAALLSNILPSTYLRKWAHKGFQDCVWPSGGHCARPTDFLPKTGRGSWSRKKEMTMSTDKYKVPTLLTLRQKENKTIICELGKGSFTLKTNFMRYLKHTWFGLPLSPKKWVVCPGSPLTVHGGKRKGAGGTMEILQKLQFSQAIRFKAGPFPNGPGNGPFPNCPLSLIIRWNQNSPNGNWVPLSLSMQFSGTFMKLEVQVSACVSRIPEKPLTWRQSKRQQAC